MVIHPWVYIAGGIIIALILAFVLWLGVVNKEIEERDKYE
jgi:ABC-type transporter Mla subunit MlaD